MSRKKRTKTSHIFGVPCASSYARQAKGLSQPAPPLRGLYYEVDPNTLSEAEKRKYRR